MKKNLLTTWLLSIMMVFGVGSVWAADKIVTKYSFDNDNSPSLVAGNHSVLDYSHTSTVTSTGFLNIYDKDNLANDITPIQLTNEDLSAETWTLSFYWAGYIGGNKRAGNVTLKAGEVVLFNILDNANGGGKEFLTYGESGTADVACVNMDKSSRFTANVATKYNTSDKGYWYLFTITGNPTDGVKMTITKQSDNSKIVDDVVLSANNVTPTVLNLQPGSIGAYGLDELLFTYFTDEEIANKPSYDLTKVAGNDRIYTATIGDSETLHYIVPGGEEQTSTTTTTEITVTQDGDLVLWTTNGAAESEHVTVAATTGALSLADIQLALTSISSGFGKTFTVTCNNTNVLLKPTATITYDFVPVGEGTPVSNVVVNGAITATEAGTYTFTATAEGYTSSTYVFENKEMVSIHSVDVTALDPTTLSTNWVKYAEQKVVGSSNQWAGKGFADARDAYWYNFASETAAATDILPGLTFEFDNTGKTPQLFTGLGLMYPVHVLGTDGVEASSPALTTGKIGIADPDFKYAVIEYHPGYGTSVSTQVLKGEETWAMNRFDKAITKYEVFKEATAPEQDCILTLKGKVGEEVSIKPGVYGEFDIFYVDFGDGVLVTDSVGHQNKGVCVNDGTETWPQKEGTTHTGITEFKGTVAGDGTIKVYGNDDIWYLAVSGATLAADQSKLKKVVQFTMSKVAVDALDLAGLDDLKVFGFSQGSLKSINVKNNAALTSLTINNNTASAFESVLENLDLSGNANLEQLNVMAASATKPGKLTTLDLSANTKLTNLYAQYNALESVILPENAAFTFINLQNNKLAAIDLSKVASFKDTYLNNNQLTEVDLSKVATGANLYLDGNQLTTVNVPVVVKNLQLNNNKLTSATIAGATASCKLENNQFTLATLPAQPAGLNTSSKTKKFTYAPQDSLKVAETVSSLDLSAQATVTAGELNSADYATYLTANTTFSFVTAGGATLVEGTDYEVTAPGKFVFLSDQAEKVHAVMLNEAFPKFTAAAPFVTTEFNVAPDKYYVVGNMTEWGVVEDNRMTLNLAADATEYMFTMDLTTSSEFKVVKDGESQTWYPGGTGNNYGQNGEITEDGKYTIYFRPNADGGEDWFNGVIYVAKVVSDDMAAAIEAAEALANADAIAVGKLQAAIAEAKAIANPIAADVAALQAAVDQFKADNADVEKDETAKVKTDGWKKFDGSAAGVCATQFAPAIDTYDGRKDVKLAESYQDGNNGDVQTTGTIIYQDITGLANGSYKVGFYGNAFFTSGRGFESTMEDGATDVAYVFANDQKEFITARIATSTTENNFRQFDVEVTDGTIKLGMGKEKPGTNWHTMQIYQLTWFTTAKAAYAAVKAEMETEIAAAKALKTESRTAGVDDFNAAIEAAEATLTSNMLNVTEFENEVANLKAAAAAFKKANWYIDFAAGEYYIIDTEGGKMMAAGHDYGTRGIVNEMGLDLTITPYTESRTVTIDSRVANGNNHFLGENLYMDSSEWGWALEYQGFGFYILEPKSGKYINLDEKDNLVLSDTPREFIIVTKEGVMAQRMEELAAATAENPVDATFLIQGANFNRNDQRNSAWTVSEDCTNKNLSGGADANRCAESYHSTFTISQAISGAPAGKYTLTAQGFFRQDKNANEVDTVETTPIFFIGDKTAEVPAKTGTEDNMKQASESFTAGQYTIEPIEFVYNGEGDLVVGIKNETAKYQWIIFDNFQLTYYGPTAATKYTVAVAETQNGEVKTDKAEAAEGETVTVTVTPAEGFKVDEAYWTTEGSETKNEFTEPEEGNAATFTMPAANVTVTVTFKAEEAAYNTNVTYALKEGDTFKSGQAVEVKNNDVVVATITYGEAGDGAEDFKAAKADGSVEGFAAFTEGNGVNGNKAGGTFYTIVPNYDGEIEVAVVLNADKAFYVEEDGTALEAYNGIKVSEKYFGTYTFNVTANKAYKVYCAGSKLGFYGFNYKYNAEVTPEPEKIESMYIMGELTGGWDFTDSQKMTQDAENAAVWTLTVEGFEAEAKTYKYKATANAKWGLYELPASGDNTFVFGTEEYPAGKYDLVFTVNTTEGTLTLVATKKEADGINTIAADRLNGVVYNLNGQKVLKAQKGLYIINGKKTMVK